MRMPRSKRLTPMNVVDSFCKVVYGKTAYQVIKDVARGKVPAEAPPESLTEEIIFDAVEDVFGPDFFEPPSSGDFIGGDAVSDGPFIRFRERGRPRTQSAAHEYAEWFRLQAERARAERGGGSDTIPPETPPEMTQAEACRILGISLDAGKPEIKMAFRRLAQKWHPDVCVEGKERGEKMFTKIALAYHRLSRPS